MKAASLFRLWPLCAALTAQPGFALEPGQPARPPKQGLAFYDNQSSGKWMNDYFRGEIAKISGSCLSNVQSSADWEARRPELRQQAAEMLGLHPMPPRTALNPVITGKIEAEDFTVEKLNFQSQPHLYVTASLYLPKPLTNAAPAILYLCGHLPAVADGISYGNKVSYQHHGEWFARNGYVCLVLDTLDNGEIRGTHHGTFSEGAWWWNSRGYTPAGIETWNAIRGLDYLDSRPEVDADRIGVTGRSGGGAYCWFLAALDDRVKVIAPVAGITDLKNYALDGTVDNHCDCMFFVNTYRWDYPQLAALCAPRPLLLVNTDADALFPLDGVLRTRNAVKRIYDLFGASTNFGLVIAPGPHLDTQDVQLPVFRWFNHYLKHEDPAIAMAAVKMFSPAQLRVLDRIPPDQINTTIQNSFVPMANPPAIPTTAKAWAQMRDAWMKDLKVKCFAGWPQEARPPLITRLYSAEAGGIQYQDYAIRSQTSIDLRLCLVQAAHSSGPRKLILRVADAPLMTAPEAGAASPRLETQLKQDILEKPVVYAVFQPRGFLAGGSSGDEGGATHLRRRFMLIGQTLDGMRVWDIRRAIQAIHSMARFRELPIDLEASSGLGVDAMYASLFEPGINSLRLDHVPATHLEGPDYLNVLKYLDIPQAAAMAAARCPLELQPDGVEGWNFLRAMAASGLANVKVTWLSQ